MPIFQSGQVEIELLKKIASPEELRKFFKFRIREWRYPIRCDECFTVGVFDDLISAISPAIAFDLLSTAVSIAREWIGSEILITALALIEDLARKADSTQLPVGLTDLLCEIDSAQNGIPVDALAGIKSWYRL